VIDPSFWGDLDGDGVLELVSPGAEGLIYVWKADGSPLPGWPICQQPGGGRAAPALGDINGDGFLEVITGDNSVKQTRQGWQGYVHVYRYNGVEYEWSPLRPFGCTGLTSIALGDVDRDGHIEMVAFAIDDFVGRLYMWKFASSGGNIAWPMVRHDPWHTNQYGFQIPTKVKKLAEMKEKFSPLLQIYPNPSSGATQMCYQLLGPGKVTLKILNPLGQEVKVLVDSYKNQGKFLVYWDGRDRWGKKVATGIYFCMLQVRHVQILKKVVIIH